MQGVCSYTDLIGNGSLCRWSRRVSGFTPDASSSKPRISKFRVTIPMHSHAKRALYREQIKSALIMRKRLYCLKIQFNQQHQLSTPHVTRHLAAGLKQIDGNYSRSPHQAPPKILSSRLNKPGPFLITSSREEATPN